MVPKQALQRVFHIYFDGVGAGTGFAFVHADREYLITARHVMKARHASGPAPVEVLIARDGEWYPHRIVKIVVGDGELDAAVIALDRRLAPAGMPPLDPVSDAGCVLGQEVFALGFPDGLGIAAGDINRKFPIPFARHGYIAGWQDPNSPDRRIVVDGHVNDGMSGGPVIVSKIPDEVPSKAWGQVALVGIILAFTARRRRVKRAKRAANEEPTKLPKLYYRVNEGLFDVLAVKCLIPLIERNGCGVSVSGNSV